MSTSDALHQLIEHATEGGVRKALNVSEATKRRLLSIVDAATYLSLSKREVYNMISTGEFAGSDSGRRKMPDIRDLDLWIVRNKNT